MVLDFLAALDVGRLVPAVEGGNAGSDVSEWELQSPEAPGTGRGEGGIGEGAVCRGEIGWRGGATIELTHALFHGIRRRGLGGGSRSLLLLSFVSHSRSVFSSPL